MRQRRYQKAAVAAIVPIVLVSAFSLPAFASETDSTEPGAGKGRIARPSLTGRVEQKDKLELLSRPQVGLNESVKILDEGSAMLRGSAMDPMLSGGSEKDALNSVLDADNFNLNYRQLTPQTDPGTLSSARGRMTSRKPCCAEARLILMMRRGFGYGYEPPRWRQTNFSGLHSDNWDLQREGVHAEMMPNSFPSRWPQPISMGNSIRPIHSTPLPASDWSIPPIQPIKPVQPLYVDQNIAWDNWYKTVSDALYKNWSKLNALPGEARLRITVSSTRKIDAQILSTTNFKPEFKETLTKAIASLNGASILAFPPQSKRFSVSFQTMFSAGTQGHAGAFSERTNDVERVRNRK